MGKKMGHGNTHRDLQARYLKRQMDRVCNASSGDILDALKALENEALALGIDTTGKSLGAIKREVAARKVNK